MFYMNEKAVGRTRYDLAQFMQFVQGMYDSLDSAWIRELRALPAAGRFIVSDEEGRPDLLARRCYGDMSMWTVPLLYNQIVDVDTDLVRGIQMRYPSLASVEALYFEFVTRARARGNRK